MYCDIKLVTSPTYSGNWYIPYFKSVIVSILFIIHVRWEFNLEK